MGEELEQLQADRQVETPKGQARRKALPAQLPRTEIRHEPESTTCACGCQMRRIGEDVAEKQRWSYLFTANGSFPPRTPKTA